MTTAPERFRILHGAERAADQPEPEQGAFEAVRQPPQDLLAEQSVLGGMLMSKDAISDVVEKVRGEDFYKPSHQQIYEIIVDLFGRGEPADAVTVAAEMDRRGLLRRIGGAPYLHTLIATVPTAANAGYYAGIVAEKATLRRLVEAGTRVVQYGYAGAYDGADVSDVVDRAQAAIYDVTQRESSQSFDVLADLLQGTMDELDALATNGGMSRGVPTGFTDLDELTNGLHPGQMVTVAARPGVGKALALDTCLPTPAGWTCMGDVAVGDQLLGADGRPTTVVAVTEVLHGRPCYDVEFSDGTTITADEQHQWSTRGGVLITAHLAAGMTIVRPEPVEMPAAAGIPISAYQVGRRLAGEHTRGTDFEPWAWRYLRGSLEQRWDMLRGVIEAATVSGGPGDSFTIAATWFRAEHRTLVLDLLTTLGFIPDRGWPGQPIHIPAGERTVRAVHARHTVPVRCVQVDNSDHLYLAGRGMVPTHNSTLALDFMRSASIKHGLPSIIFSLEMSKSEIVTRLLSAEASIKLADMRAGRMGDDDWTKLARLMSRISEAPLFIDDSPNLTMTEIRAKARRLAAQQDLKLIVIDYMQLMTTGKRVESRQQEVSEISRSIKLLAKELSVPVVALSQLNRGPEQRVDKKPMISDLRESGAVEQDSDVVLLLHRPDAIDYDSPRGGEVDLIVGKHRNGPTRTLTLAHQLHLSRFANMAREFANPNF